MKKIILLLLTLALSFNIACNNTADAAATPKQIKTYLVAGIDDAAENTDVLILASYNMTDGTATAVHIPRDTFCKYDEKYRKINGIFPYERGKGLTKDEAMSRLVSYISDVLGVIIDGYFCIDKETLIEAVDLIGGVDVVLDRELPIMDERGVVLYTLNPGKNHLDGEAAARFIRYRKGYVDGDLGRIAAQKLFLSALLGQTQKSVGIAEAVRMYVKIMPRISTNVGITELVDMILNARVHSNKKDVNCVTLPGDATIIQKTSYYIINRKSAAELLERDFLMTNGGFDPERLLTDESNRTVENIYNKY